VAMQTALIKTGPVLAVPLAGNGLSRLEHIEELIESLPDHPLAQYFVTLPSDQSRTTALSALLRAARMMRVPFARVLWHTMQAKYLKILLDRMRRRYSPATVNTTLAVLRGLARQCWILELMPTDDYLRIKELKGSTATRIPPGRALTAKEIALLMESCARDPNEVVGDRDAALIALLCTTGVRKSEAISLELKSYDPMTYALRVHGKRDKERWAYFDDGGARRALLAWIKRRGRKPGPLLNPINRRGEVLTDKNMSPATLHKAISTRARKAGVEHFSPHDLRRTFGTDLLGGGADIAVVRMLLGHVKLETTATYDRRREEIKRRELRRLSKFPYRPRPRHKPRRGKRRHKRRFPTPKF
jgi:integrase/recombinase XerD